MLRTPVARLSGTHDGALPSTRDPGAVTAAYWPELCAIPKDFVLYGGTALALHLGHRESADFDFFGGRNFDVRALETGIPFLAGAKIIQRAEGTLTAIVQRGRLRWPQPPRSTGRRSIHKSH